MVQTLSVPVTDRQWELIQFLRSYFAEKQRMPSVREIGEAMNISSPNGVTSHIRALKRKGLLDYDPHVARSLRLVGELATPPVLGTVVGDEGWVHLELLDDGKPAGDRETDVVFAICSAYSIDDPQFVKPTPVTCHHCLAVIETVRGAIS